MTTLHAHGGTRLPSRQRGWAGIVMILVALVIVAIVAKEALKGYGLAPGARRRRPDAAERARMPGAIGRKRSTCGRRRARRQRSSGRAVSRRW
jgi:hypothetical protein